MQRTLQIARQAARRRRWRRFVSLGGPMLLLTTTAGAAAALTDRLIGPAPGVEWWNWVVWPAAAGLGVAAGLAIAQKQPTDSAAIEVDTSMHLNDRLASAISLSGRAGDDPFVALAVDEAERAAAGVNVSRAIPVRWGRSWSMSLVMAWIAAGIGYFVEPMHLMDAKPPPGGPRARFNERAATEAREALKEVAEALKPEDGQVADAAAEDKRLEVIDQLSRELNSESRPPEETLAKAASVLEEAATEASRSAEQSRAASEELKETLAQLPPDEDVAAEEGAGENPQPQSLRDEIRTGELGKAAESLEELQKQMENMPRSQREAMAQDFDELAKDLKEQAEKQQAEAEKRGEESKEELKSQGLSEEQAEPLAEQSDEEKIEEALKKQGFSEEVSERLAKELAEENRRREAEQKAAEDAKKLSEAAEQAAEQLREEPTPGQNEPKPEQPEKPDQNEPSKDGSSKEESQQGQKQEQGSQQKQQQQGEQEKEGEGEQGEEKPGTQPSQKKTEPGDQPGGEKPEKKEGEKGTDPSQQTPPIPGIETSGAPREEKQSGKPDAAKPDSSKAPDPNQEGKKRQPGEKPGEQPADGKPQAEPGTPPPGMPPNLDALKHMQKVLEQMEQKQQEGQDQQQRSKELQEQAKKLLEKATPEQKEQMMKWAQQAMREQGKEESNGSRGAGSGKGDNSALRGTGQPSQTEDVDIRRRGEKERIAAEWTRPGVSQPDRTISQREFEQQLLDAQEAAQKAMEEQTIPARYGNVKEFYKRALKKAEEEKATPPPPAPPAPAAPDAKKP